MPPRDENTIPQDDEPPQKDTAAAVAVTDTAACGEGVTAAPHKTPSIIISGVGRDHNTPSHTGWRRNTFHWELNVWTFGFLALLYYHVLPLSWRFGMQLLLGLVCCDAARYYYAKGDLPGVPYTLPFVSVVAMIVHPVRFWAELGTIAMESGEGLCTNILGGNFMIFVTDTKLCREIMTTERAFGIFAHPNALWLFGPRNLIYMDTEPHKQFRAILTPALFGKTALLQYAECQERVCRHYMNQFVQQCGNSTKQQPIDVRVAFRTMAAASSQEAFLGPYLTDADRKQLERDIVTFTMGFLSFPFPYLGFGLSQAIQAKDRIEAIIQRIVPLARAYIVDQGHAPRCMLEHWTLAIHEAGPEKRAAMFCEEDDMARTVLDFLFAAQDATNSALAYSLDVLDEDRPVLQQLRDEVDRECTHTQQAVWTRVQTDTANTNTTTTTSGCLSYTQKVANQLLHHKPPVPMIPHKAKRTTTLAGRTVRRGTIAIPSITYSARTSGRSVHFDPEREDADPLFVQTVVFGGGQHKCPGRRYAESLLTVFLGVLAQDYDFHRTEPRPFVDEFIYFPTCFPKDCQFVITKREQKRQQP